MGRNITLLVARVTLYLHNRQPPAMSKRNIEVLHGGLIIEDLLKNLDIDGDGDIDEEDRKLGETLKSMDTDGDGTISLKELVSVCSGKIQDKAHIKNLKRLVGLVILASLVFCGVMVGLMIVANEASKDSKPESGGALKTIDGKDVTTAISTTEINLEDLPQVPQEVLRKTTTLNIETDTGLQFYQVSGWTWVSTKEMTFYTTRGDVIHIKDGHFEITSGESSGNRVLHRRSLLGRGGFLAATGTFRLSGLVPRK